MISVAAWSFYLDLLLFIYLFLNIICVPISPLFFFFYNCATFEFYFAKTMLTNSVQPITAHRSVAVPLTLVEANLLKLSDRGRNI